MKKLVFKEDTSILIDDIYCKYYIENIDLPLVITFSPANLVISNNDVEEMKSPWGFDFMKKRGFNVISFSCTKIKNWYRNESFALFIEELSQHIEIFKLKMGYGSSMGGFAVSAYSNVLQLDRLLLINPISTLNMDLVAFETRFKKAKIQLNWDKGYYDGAVTKSKGYIIYDPLYTLDRKHADRFQSLTHLKIPGLGHSMPEHLKNMGILSTIVDGFLKNTLDDIEFYKLTRARRNLPRYYNWMYSDENRHLTDLRKHIIKTYAKKQNISVSDKKVTTLTADELDLIRDSAVLLEDINIEMSLNLMRIAHNFRPKAPFVNLKIKEYKKIIG